MKRYRKSGYSTNKTYTPPPVRFIMDNPDDAFANGWYRNIDGDLVRTRAKPQPKPIHRDIFDPRKKWARDQRFDRPKPESRGKIPSYPRGKNHIWLGANVALAGAYFATVGRKKALLSLVPYAVPQARLAQALIEAMLLLGLTYNFGGVGEPEFPPSGTSTAVCGLNLGGTVYGAASNCVIPLQPVTNRGVVTEWNNPFNPPGQKYGYQVFYHQNITADVLPGIDYAEACGKYAWATGDVSLGDTDIDAFRVNSPKVFPIIPLNNQILGQLVSLMPNFQPLLGAGITPEPIAYKDVPYRQPVPDIIGEYQFQTGYGEPATPPPNTTPEIVPPISATIRPHNTRNRSRSSWDNAPNVIRKHPSGNHLLKKPGRGTKEKKGKARGIIAGVLKIRNALTEVNDVLDSILKSMPGKPKGWQNWTEHEKAQYIYRYANEIDVPEAARNLVLDNLVVDRVIGGVHGKISKSIDAAAGGRAPIGSKALINRAWWHFNK